MCVAWGIAVNAEYIPKLNSTRFNPKMIRVSDWVQLTSFLVKVSLFEAFAA